MRICLNWDMIIKWVCPCCLSVQYHSEIIDKVKGRAKQRIKCRSCGKEIKLGEKRRRTKKVEGGRHGRLVEPEKGTF